VSVPSTAASVAADLHETCQTDQGEARARRVARSATERTCPPIPLAGSSIHNQPDATIRAMKTITAIVTTSATTAKTAAHPIWYGVSCVRCVTVWGR
jgi:hypothetical protein